MRSIEHTALLIAVMFHRSAERRARLSAKTLRVIAMRKTLRISFVGAVIDALQRDHGICMTELDAGGFGLIYFKALEAAKSVTSKKFLPNLPHRQLTSKEEAAYLKEVQPDPDEEDDEDDTEHV